MSNNHTAVFFKEFEELGECQVKINFDFQPEEDDTNTAAAIEVESGSFLYNEVWIELTDYDAKRFEEDCWNYLAELNEENER